MRTDSARTDSIIFMKYSARVSLYNLYSRRMELLYYKADGLYQPCSELVVQCESTELRLPVDLAKNGSKEKGTASNVSRHMRIQLPVSLRIPGYPPATTGCKVMSAFLYFPQISF